MRKKEGTVLGARWAPVPVATEEHTVVSRAVWGSGGSWARARPELPIPAPYGGGTVGPTSRRGSFSPPLQPSLAWQQTQRGAVGFQTHPAPLTLPCAVPHSASELQ